MIEKYLSPGDKVEIRFAQRMALTDENTERKYKTYLSKINQMLDEDQIEILMPIEQSRMVLLPRNAMGTLVIYTSNGLFQCEVKVADRYKKDNIYLQVLELISGIKKYQRREYYRYSCTVPVFSRCLSEEEQKTMVWDETQKGIEGSTLDIGGGGVRYLVSEQMTSGEMVICYLELEIKNTVKEIQALGKILSVRPVKDSNLFEVRVQFEKISNAAREQIIQYIFEDERKRRKKSNGL